MITTINCCITETIEDLFLVILHRHILGYCYYVFLIIVPKTDHFGEGQSISMILNTPAHGSATTQKGKEVWSCLEYTEFVVIYEMVLVSHTLSYIQYWNNNN